MKRRRCVLCPQRLEALPECVVFYASPSVPAQPAHRFPSGRSVSLSLLQARALPVSSSPLVSFPVRGTPSGSTRGGFAGRTEARVRLQLSAGCILSPYHIDNGFGRRPARRSLSQTEVFCMVTTILHNIMGQNSMRRVWVATTIEHGRRGAEGGR